MSGRGPGKSAFIGMISHWMRSTQLGSSTIVAANNEAQLKSRTFAEINKWNTMALNGHWFETSTLNIRPAPWFDALLRTELKIDTGYYYTQGQLWTEDNPDAFAGVHNHNGMMVLFDEASGIPSPIWKVTEGFFTDPVDARYWMAFSNGRRNTGMFFETHHKFRDQWRRRQIDSRQVEGVDLAVYQQIIDQYGIDSDEARVEVYGQFPRTGDRQLIGRDVVLSAQAREAFPDDGAPLLMGVDVARFGDDHSVIRFRKGRDARSIPKVKLKGADTVTLALRVAELADRHDPDAIFVDGGGVGGGVVDQLKAMKYNVIEVQFGSKPNDVQAFENKRTEIWDLMAQWMMIGCIDPKDSDLADDLTAPEFSFNPVSNKKRLEPKEQTKKRGFASPDDADALAVTFAQTVARRDRSTSRRSARGRVARDVDYDLLG